ncbi:MAG: PilZ domain-containing protein [Pyrinomonadaceae bacterium]
MREPTEERRNARRVRARLDLRTILMATRVTPDGEEQVLTFLAYTHDISETGLALIVTGQVATLLAPLGETYKLQLVLSLPKGSIELEARPVRYASFERSDSAPHTLIGAQITEMDEDNRTRFHEYLKTLISNGAGSPAASSPIAE